MQEDPEQDTNESVSPVLARHRVPSFPRGVRNSLPRIVPVHLQHALPKLLDSSPTLEDTLASPTAFTGARIGPLNSEYRSHLYAAGRTGYQIS